MRKLMIERMVKMMFAYQTPEHDSTQWGCIFELIARQHRIDLSTKEGRKYLKKLNLRKVNYAAFSDDDLLEVFELVCYRATLIL